MRARNGHKFNAVKTVIDGITFASKAEARHYAELRLLVKRGEIRNLRLQPRYPLYAGPRPEAPTITIKKICDYVADFEYESDQEIAGFWLKRVVDVKGMKTDTYRLKKKLFEAQYCITITEIGRATPVTQAKRAQTTRRSAAPKAQLKAEIQR